MSTGISIKGTYDSPTVIFDPQTGVFEIEGRSLPPNSFEFYSPVMEKMREYLNSPSDKSVFNFKLDFISSSSTKIFQELFYLMEESFQKGYKIQTNWYYKFGDDDMKELGDDLRTDTTFPFEFVAFE